MSSPATPSPPSAQPRWPRVLLLSLATALLVGYLVSFLDSTVFHYSIDRIKCINRCTSNLTQIGIALEAYAADNEDKYPSSPAKLFPRWCTQEDIFDCPGIGIQRNRGSELREDLSRSYRYVSYPTNILKSTLLDFPIIFDRGTNHSLNGMNVLYGDGHAVWEKRPEFIAKLRNMASNEKLPASCREVLKRTLKTVEEEVQK